MRENSKTIELRGMVNTSGKTVRSMWDIGRISKCTERENSLGLMGILSKALTKMVLNTVPELLNGLTVINAMEYGKRENKKIWK